MFEHMKGYPHLFAKVATWLKPKGKVFIHVFVHKDTPYEFEDDDGWMSKHFFSGGTMPSVSRRCWVQSMICFFADSVAINLGLSAGPFHVLPEGPCLAKVVVHSRYPLRPDPRIVAPVARLEQDRRHEAVGGGCRE
jgi:hypothetical protein